MKKTFIALLLLSGGFAVGAQETQNTNTDSTRNTSGNITDSMTNNMNQNMNQAANTDNTTRSTSSAYNAYGTATNIPYKVQQNFQTEHPGISDARWEQANDLWRVNYKNNGQDMNVYYGANGQSFMVALPVLQNQVPEEVVSKVKELHGNNVYDITTMRGADSTEFYQIRIMEAGQLRAQRINADGSEWVEAPPTDNTNMNADSSNMNNTNNWNNNTNTNTDTTTSNTTDTTTNNGTISPTTDSTTTDSTATDINGTTTTDDNSASNNNQQNNTSNTTGSEMNTTNPTNGKEEELKIKTKSSDGTETKVKVEKGEVKIKED